MYRILNRDDFKKLEQLLDKYELPKEPFFFVPNQFWQHKNHPVVLKALLLAKEKEPNLQVWFCGKEHDHRNPDYADTLRQFIVENGMSENTRFLGFIEREDQLAFMRFAQAIIQPSLFEGWSTVVEDAKSVGQRLIISNLDVHREQLANWPVSHFLFSAHDAHQLAKQMLVWYRDDWELYSVPNSIYLSKITKFANDFLAMTNQI